MFMVEYQPGGVAHPHDHPLEEAYRRSCRARSRPWPTASTTCCKEGDVFWTGVGCIHAFWNRSDTTVRWLETSSPRAAGAARLQIQPGLGLPRREARHQGLSAEAHDSQGVAGMADDGSDRRRYAGAREGAGRACLGARGEAVFLSGRDQGRRGCGRRRDRQGRERARHRPDQAARHRRCAQAGRDGRHATRHRARSSATSNTARDYNIDRAIKLATLKLVGYTEVIHALAGRPGARTPRSCCSAGSPRSGPIRARPPSPTVNGGGLER